MCWSCSGVGSRTPSSPKLPVASRPTVRPRAPRGAGPPRRAPRRPPPPGAPRPPGGPARAPGGGPPGARAEPRQPRRGHPRIALRVLADERACGARSFAQQGRGRRGDRFRPHTHRQLRDRATLGAFEAVALLAFIGQQDPDVAVADIGRDLGVQRVGDLGSAARRLEPARQAQQRLAAALLVAPELLGAHALGDVDADRQHALRAARRSAQHLTVPLDHAFAAVAADDGIDIALYRRAAARPGENGGNARLLALGNASFDPVPAADRFQRPAGQAFEAGIDVLDAALRVEHEDDDGRRIEQPQHVGAHAGHWRDGALRAERPRHRTPGTAVRTGGQTETCRHGMLAAFSPPAAAQRTPENRAIRSGRLALRAPALVFLEVALAHADRLRRDLDQLVVVDEIDGVLERQLDRRRDLDRVFLA